MTNPDTPLNPGFLNSACFPTYRCFHFKSQALLLALLQNGEIFFHFQSGEILLYASGVYFEKIEREKTACLSSGPINAAQGHREETEEKSRVRKGRKSGSRKGGQGWYVRNRERFINDSVCSKQTKKHRVSQHHQPVNDKLISASRNWLWNVFKMLKWLLLRT